MYTVWYSKNSKKLDPNPCDRLDPDSAMTEAWSQNTGSLSYVELGSSPDLVRAGFLFFWGVIYAECFIYYRRSVLHLLKQMFHVGFKADAV